MRPDKSCAQPEDSDPQAELVPPMKPTGRPPVTGRFSSRGQLLERIWFLDSSTNLSGEKIAASVGVSQGAVLKILRTGEGRPAPERDRQDRCAP